MKKFYLVLAGMLAMVAVHSQNVGIGTNDPKTQLDVSGALSLREGPAITSLSAGNNDNVVLPTMPSGRIASFYRITTNPASAFSILGIVPLSGADGQVITLVNTTGQVMTIKNNASSTPANGFRTLSGADMVSVAGNSSVTFQYNKGESRWFVTGSQNFGTTSVGASNGLTATPSGATVDVKLGGTLTAATDVALGGNNLAFSGTGNVGIGIASPVRKLDINGATRMRDWLSFGSNDDIGRITWGTDRFYMNGFAGRKLSLGSNANVDQLLIDLSGNVGINQTTPAARLDVNGNTKLTTVNQGATSTERFYPNVVSSAINNTFNGAWIIHSPLPRATGAMFTIRVHGYGYGSAEVIDFTISGYAYGGVNGSIDGQSGAITNTKLSDVGTDSWEKYVGIDNAGNVAIAFGNPASTGYYYRLSVDAWVTHVGGDYSTGWSIDQNTTNVSSTNKFGWRDLTGPMTSSIKGAIAINAAGGVGVTGLAASSAVFTDASGNLSTSVPGASPILYWTRNSGSAYLYNTSTNDNVGIGTTSPQKRLDVVTPANSYVTVGAAVLGIGQWAGIHFGYREDGNSSYRKSAIVFERTDNSGGGGNAAGRIHLLNGPVSGSGSATLSDARLTVGETGNVGIGNISPAQKLDVTGNINATGSMTQGPLISRPNATWSFGGPSTGAVIIKLPGGISNYGMLHMEIDVYEYDAPGAVKYIVGGHNWSGQWHNYNCHTIGNPGKKIRLGFKDGQYAIILGEQGSVWSYGHVVLSKITNGGYYSGTIDLGGTYSVTQDNNPESYTWITGDLNQQAIESQGTTNYLARWTGAHTLGIGVSYDNGTRLGVGTTSPQDMLDVNGHLTLSGGGREIRFRNAAGTTEQYVWHSGTSLGLGAGGGSTSMFITAGGNVGIGTGGAITKLQVEGGILRTNTRVSSAQRYPVAHDAGDNLFAIDPTWSNAELQTYFGSTQVNWTNESDAPGGWSIAITGPVNVGGSYNSGFPYIAIDNNATYYMECWIKNTSGTNNHYMGSIDYDANFANGGGNPGSYGYWVMSNYNPGSSWTKVTGYIGGHGTAVGTFANGSRYFTPQALFNYSGGGNCVISGWKVTKVSSIPSNAVGSTSGSANMPSQTWTDARSITITKQRSDTPIMITGNFGGTTVGSGIACAVRIVRSGSVLSWNYGGTYGTGYAVGTGITAYDAGLAPGIYTYTLQYASNISSHLTSTLIAAELK